MANLIQVKRTRIKKLPLYKRAVCSLAAAEIAENYDTDLMTPDPPIVLSSRYKVKNQYRYSNNFSTNASHYIIEYSGESKLGCVYRKFHTIGWQNPEYICTETGPGFR